MELKFDKEIDAILRGVAKQPNFANSPNEHLDADMISAFAENVLTGDARIQAMSHFADCNRCRIILTNVVKLNSEFEQETVHAVATPIIETKQVSWFEKLFTVPNLAYTFGALTIVFVGIIGLTFLQGDKNSDVAQLDKNEPAMSKGTSGASSDGNEIAKESYSANSNAVASNSSSSVANAVTNSSMPAANVATPLNSTAILPKDVATSNSAANSAAKNQTVAKNLDKDAKPSNKINQPISEIPEKEEERAITLDAPAPAKPLPTPTDLDKSANDSMGGEGRVSEDEKTETTRSGKAIPKAKKDTTKSPTLMGGALAKPTTEEKEATANNKTVSGKSFRNVNGIWTDSAYTGGGTKKVKRSSNDYKKLDQGLQNIGNSLGGTVIVVWNGKAYKIQ